VTGDPEQLVEGLATTLSIMGTSPGFEQGCENISLLKNNEQIKAVMMNRLIRLIDLSVCRFIFM
jgi:hypothetical protein